MFTVIRTLFHLNRVRFKFCLPLNDRLLVIYKHFPININIIRVCVHKVLLYVGWIRHCHYGVGVGNAERERGNKAKPKKNNTQLHFYAISLTSSSTKGCVRRSFLHKVIICFEIL